MAWVLVRLKLRLLRNGLRGNALRAIAFILGCAYALAIGTAIAAGFLSLQHRIEDLVVVAELVAVAAASDRPSTAMSSSPRAAMSRGSIRRSSPW